MTNTPQTKPLLLDGVEPLAWANPYGGFISAKYKETLASGLEKQTHTLPLYTRETLEPVIKALLDANRKEVLLEAAKGIESEIGAEYSPDAAWAASKLRRMALEPTGVDKGEKE